MEAERRTRDLEEQRAAAGEETGLDYASDVVAADARGERTHVMHACGHDMHVTCLCGAAAELAATTGT